MVDSPKFGDVLRSLRASRGWSQRTLGFKYGQLQGKEEGIAASVIATWERNKRAVSRDVVSLLAQALRATDTERDAMLVAAGFMPESADLPGKLTIIVRDDAQLTDEMKEEVVQDLDELLKKLGLA